MTLLKHYLSPIFPYYFQTGRAHLLLISRTPGKAGGALGVVTLEDIIEVTFFCFSASGNLADAPKEIISEEIVDETDRYEDNQSKRRAKRLTTSAVMRGIVERVAKRTESTLGERTPLLSTNVSPAPYGSGQPDSTDFTDLTLVLPKAIIQDTAAPVAMRSKSQTRV
ncbi:hypothetical protein AX14_005254 [Amanita brunnescens Koide BX004]|nr:hypothetical protein AX14_005254 [Amanita brunnescens Koide BX004]